MEDTEIVTWEVQYIFLLFSKLGIFVIHQNHKKQKPFIVRNVFVKPSDSHVGKPQKIGENLSFWGDKSELWIFQVTSSYPFLIIQMMILLVAYVLLNFWSRVNLGFYMPIEVLCECTYTSSGIWTSLQILLHICESTQEVFKWKTVSTSGSYKSFIAKFNFNAMHCHDQHGLSLIPLPLESAFIMLFHV